MLEADQIVDLLTMAGVLAMIAVPFLSIALAFAGRIAWGQAKDRHAAEVAADRLKRRLEDVEAIRARDAVWRATHRHADGGAYRMEREANGKHPDTGEWVEGVIYSGEDGEWRWTDAARWAMRFTMLIREVAAPGVYSRDQAERTARRNLRRSLDIPDTGRDGTDVRELAGSFADPAAPSIIRTHLGDPPYSGDGWHDEYGRECG